MADAAKPRMDFRTLVFFAMTLSLCLNTVVCFIGSLGLPVVKAFTLVTYRAALMSAPTAFLYRIAYSIKAPASITSLAGWRASLAPVLNSNGAHYVIYSIVFAMGRPVPTVLFPLTICGGFQLLTIANKHFPATLKRVRGDQVFALAQQEMHKMMAMCATMECSMLPLLIMELFTPARSVTRVVMYVNYLRRRYACKDDTVFRIKYTYGNAGQFHQQVWSMLGQKTSPILSRVPGIDKVLGPLKRWFTQGAAPMKTE